MMVNPWGRSRWFILDDNREAIPAASFEAHIEWVRANEEAGIDWRRVALDTMPSGVKISTVFLGIDHSWEPDGGPMVFETMIFGGEHDGECTRCGTRLEAFENHTKAVALHWGKSNAR